MNKFVEISIKVTQNVNEIKMGKNKQKKKKWEDQSKEVQIWVKVGSRKGAKKKEKK